MAEDIQQHPFHRVVVGALKDSINTHGDITIEWVGSAAKRITAAVVAEQKKIEQTPCEPVTPA